MKLEGVRVIDLSLYMPGPHMTQMMSDHGAEVICVEPPPHGEPSRNLGVKKNGHTSWFRNTHRGKKSICLNLKEKSGLDGLLELCTTADVFIEGFRPGVMTRLGAGYDQVEAINPRIVYCSITAFGQSGLYVERPAHDLSVMALSGMLSANLGADNRPALPAIPMSDMAASLMAFGAVNMALFRREKTGKGDYVDISMLDSLVGWTQNSVGPVFAEGKNPDVKQERLWGGRSFYNVYETSDGRYLTLSGNEPKFVKALLTAFARPDLIDIAVGLPGDHQQPLTDFLSDTFKQRTLKEWIDWLYEKDVCYAPVLTMKEAFESPQLAGRDMILTDEMGNLHVGIPIKFRHEAGVVDFSVPTLDQHHGQITND